jgi:hypothetical protein
VAVNLPLRFPPRVSPQGLSHLELHELSTENGGLALAESSAPCECVKLGIFFESVLSLDICGWPVASGGASLYSSTLDLCLSHMALTCIP